MSYQTYVLLSTRTIGNMQVRTHIGPTDRTQQDPTAAAGPTHFKSLFDTRKPAQQEAASAEHRSAHEPQPRTPDYPCGTCGSFGRPSTRSPTMLRWIWLVPPQIVSRAGEEERRHHRADRVARRGACRACAPGHDADRGPVSTSIDAGAEDVEGELHRRAGASRTRTSCSSRRARRRPGPSCPCSVVRQRAQAVDPQDLDLRVVRASAAGGSTGSSIAPLLAGRLDHQPVLLLEAAVAGGGRHAPLEARASSWRPSSRC